VQGGNGTTGGGGGAAAGPAIFVVNGSVTLYNTAGTGFAATGGAGGGGGAAAGTASEVPVFNYGGTVNGSMATGPIQNALTVTEPVGQTSTTQVATLMFTSAASSFTVNVLTQGTPNLDFKLVNGGTCVSGTSYAAGATCTVAYSFTPAYPGLRYGGITLVAGSGSSAVVVANAPITGIGTGPQVAFQPGAVSLMNVGTPGGVGLKLPNDVALDGAGNVYIADSGNNRIVEVTAAGASSVVNVGTPGGVALNRPEGLALDGAGSLFIADDGNNRVVELTAAGVSTVVNVGTPGGLALSLSYGGLNVDGAGNLYIADTLNNRIVEVTAAGVSSVVNVGTPDGAGLHLPYGVTVDDQGNLYIGDVGNNRVVELTAAGISSVVNPGAPGGLTVNAPQIIGTDGVGNIYIPDSGNKRVVELTVQGGVTVLTVGTPGGVGLSNSIGATRVNGAGVVYIADYANNRIVEVNQATAATVVFATPTIDGTIDTTDFTNGVGTVTLSNYGNAPLLFGIPGTGNNPSVSSDFTLTTTGSADCPSMISSSGTEGQLAAGMSCELPVGFAPVVPADGTVSGSVVVTDNNLNALPNAMQTIHLSGTAVASLVLTPTSLAAATAGVPYSVMLSASGGAASDTYTYAVTAGALPAGMMLNAAGLLSGTPTVAGMFNFTVTATDTAATTLTGTQMYTLLVNPGVPVLSFAAVPGKMYGNPPFTVTASSMSSGAVTYSVVSGAATVGASSGLVTLTGAGPVVLKAMQATTASYTSATAETTVMVARQASATSVSATPTVATPVQTVTLTAMVAATVPGTAAVPSGTVMFLANGVALGAAVNVVNGTATLVVPSLPPGATAVITAVYSGDGNFAGSTSGNSASVVVAAFDFTFTDTGAAAYTAAPGAVAKYSFGLAPLYGSYAGPVSFSVTGLPMGAVASFTPSSVAVGGGALPVVMTVQTAAATARNGGGPSPFGRGIELALLLLPLLGRRKIRERMKGKMLLLVLLMAGLTATLTGCGTTNGFLLQSPQTYTLTVTATSGALQHSQTVKLIVQ
jgi:sugar lactone lactonase YvrE